MKTDKKIHWTKAIKLIKQEKKILQNEIDFNNEMIHWTIVQELNHKGYRVPEQLIDYDDKNIDYSDIPELNDETLKNGTYRTVLTLSCDYEIAKWIQNSKVNYNLLINNFLKSVYQSIQTIK